MRSKAFTADCRLLFQMQPSLPYPSGVFRFSEISHKAAYSIAFASNVGLRMGQRWLDGYSAAVEVYLLINGERHEIAQIGGNSFILRGTPDIPAQTSATLVVRIDGQEERQEILILEDARHEEPVAFI